MSRPGVMAGHAKRTFYLPEGLLLPLKRASVETGTPEYQIAARALRKELSAMGFLPTYTLRFAGQSGAVEFYGTFEEAVEAAEAHEESGRGPARIEDATGAVVAWVGWCPACGRRLVIEPEEVGPSEADPTEWAPKAFVDLCGCRYR